MIFKTFLILLASLAAISDSSPEEHQELYVIHMDQQATKMTTFSNSFRTPRRWYEDVLSSVTTQSSAASRSPPPELLYVYDTALYGFAAKLSSSQLESLKRINGFISAIPDEILTLHTTHSPRFLGLRNGKGLWTARTLATDVIVGVVDTGIWPEHASFRDDGMTSSPSQWKGACEAGSRFAPSNCNNKLIGARIFYKGYEAIVGRINWDKECKSPRDSQGHGTHTASTIAGDVVGGASLLGLANGSAVGMKYTSRIAAYKACYLLGCSSTDVLAAIDQAVLDGVDVISLSLGGLLPKPFYTDNIAIASFGAIQKGVFICTSAGNSGPLDSSVGNTAPWIMTVAASSIDRSFPTIVELGNGNILRGQSLYSGKPTKLLPLVYGKGGNGAEFCINGSLSSRQVKGRIVVCERGSNGKAEKGEVVKRAGGSGMIILNRETDGEEVYADPHLLPATGLGASPAIAIKQYINNTNNSIKTATASIKFLGTVYGNRAPVMASFSSRGPSVVSPEIIKPDITAPGVHILAAWPANVGPTLLKNDMRSVEFNVLSGTSMSCPHVTGLAALLKSVHTNWSPAAIKSAIMTTAYTLDSRGAPITDFVAGNSTSATPFVFGSGHVDPEKAVNPGLVYDISTQDYLNYLCGLNYDSTQITLVSRRKFTCPIVKIPHPGDLNYPSFAVNFYGGNSSYSFKRVVTNVGTPRSVYAVYITEPAGVSVVVKPRVLKFKKLGEKMSYSVTFGRRGGVNHHSFGSLVWKSTKYAVRSPIAVTWL
ncbi:unnamed protein product [Cuscuta europaea]|uniref:Subtilisin-like protease SBT1.1 n=1 Tax=Cuscuta europaea TaxID=41803 RepID=A0A9P0ZDV7_CUSEU|nr:unnamed protein product [Cuscuta europaea]